MKVWDIIPFCLDKEIWKDIVGYEGLYQVSNSGKIKSCAKNKGWFNIDESIMKPRKDTWGYLYINLRQNRTSKSFKVHRLVAIHFNPNPYNLPQVNHEDCNKLNNNSYNLKWCTQEYNMTHAKQNGLFFNGSGERQHSSKLKVSDILDIRKSKLSYSKLAKIYNVSSANIWSIKKYQTWKTVTID